MSGSPSILVSIIGTLRATVRGGSATSAGLPRMLASAMAAAIRLPLLFPGVWVDCLNTFFRSVSLPICQRDLKGRMAKSVGEAEGCLLVDGVKPESKAQTTLVAELRFYYSSSSPRSAVPLRTLCPSAKTYLASGTPLLRQDTRYSNFAPLTLGAPRAGLPPSLAPGESGGTLAIQPYPRRYWLHNLTPHAS